MTSAKSFLKPERADHRSALFASRGPGSNRTPISNLNPSGFTLIEVMVVIAIVSILASIAIVIMQSFIARSQVSAGLADIRGGASAFEERLIFKTDPILLPSEIGLQANTAACSTITVSGGSDGTIECELDGHFLIRGNQIGLYRDEDSGLWECNTTGIDSRYRPTDCQ